MYRSLSRCGREARWRCWRRRHPPGRPAVAVEHHRFTGPGIHRRDEHRSFRPALAGQPGGDRRAPPRRPEPSDAASSSSADAPIRRRMSAGSSAAAMIRPVRSRWSDRRPGERVRARSRRPVRRGGAAKDAGEQLGRARAGDLRRGGRPGRRADDQVGLGHVHPGIEQAGDDADQPGIARRPAATEDQRSLAHHRAL